MGRKTWIVNLLRKTFHTRFSLAKATKKSKVMSKMVEKALFEDDYIIYLPLDNVIELNEEIDPAESVVLPSQIIEAFINKAKVIFRMNFCLCRSSTKCEDYPQDFGCLYLGEAAADINPKWGQQISKKEAIDYLQQTNEAGLVHLIGRNKIDTVWLGVKPKEKLLTICHCCPCCCLWKMLPDLSKSLSSKVTKMPGVEIEVNDQCVGCGICADRVCFVDAITLIDGKAVISDECRGCGRCASACPSHAIQVKITNDDFYNECVDKITSLVDVE